MFDCASEKHLIICEQINNIAKANDELDVRKTTLDADSKKLGEYRKEHASLMHSLYEQILPDYVSVRTSVSRQNESLLSHIYESK